MRKIWSNLYICSFSSGDLPSTDQILEESVCSKAQQRKVYKARLSYKKEWEQKYFGCTAMIHNWKCFANYVKSKEIHLLQPGVHGHLEELKIGVMQLSNSRNRASQMAQRCCYSCKNGRARRAAECPTASMLNSC